MSTLRSRLTYANVMSTIAIFLALGGGSMAAVSAPEQGVISDGQEQSGDTGAGGGSDESPGEESADDDDGGTADGNGDGEQKGDSGDGDGDGDQNGDSGDGDGDQGVGDGDERQATGLLGATTREGDTVSTGVGADTAVAVASCQDGETLSGGGVRTEPDGQNAEPIVLTSAPDGNGWSAKVQNGSGVDRVSVTAYAICAAQQP